MLNLERVYNLFCLFADLDEPDAQEWHWLCDNMAAYVGRRLRQDVDPIAEMERLCAAAAALAYDRYRLLRSGIGESGGEVKVGDISIKSSATTSGTSESIGGHFLAGIADLIQAEGAFYFGRTPAVESL